MNKYNIHFLLIVLLKLFCFSGQAQSSKSQLKGFVYGSNNEPAQFSTIALTNKDSVFLTGTVSYNDGSFQFEKMESGSYFVVVRNIEFNTFISNPIRIENEEILVLDTIILETKITGLDEIVIKGEKSLIEVHPDKMVYNVSGSVNAAGNNGLELLSKTPGVMVDMDNSITLQGKSGVRIFINGRPSRLAGSDLTNMLEGMRSDNIEAIDIITNPSSKYEAEGSGGIIDIKMKRSGLKGFNGNVIGNYSKGVHARSSLGTTINYRIKKINIYSNAIVSSNITMDNFVQTTEREKYLLAMTSNSLSDRKGLNLTGGFDYKINPKSIFGLDAKALFNNRTRDVESLTNIKSTNEDIPSENLSSMALSDYPSENYNMNMYYSYVPNGSSNFSVDFSYGKYSNVNNTLQPNTYYNEDMTEVIRTVNDKYDTETDIEMMSSKIDYEKRVNKVTFGSGAKYARISTRNNLAFYNITEDQAILDLNRSNNFSYLEKVASAYFTFGAKLTERVSLNSGLRVENTSSRGELVSANPTDEDVVARNYTSWFPNISIAYDDKKRHGLSLNIGKRITRPNYQDLNPFEYKKSEINSRKGNPFLKPNYITNYQITYAFKRKLIISNNYSITRDFFANIFESTGDKSTILIPRNMQNVYQNALSVSYSLRAFPWLNFTSFFLYNYSKYNGNLNGAVINIESNTFSFRLQNIINLPKEIRMELTYYARSPWIWRGSIYLNEIHRVNLGFKREFLKKKLLLQLTAIDILRTSSDFYYNSNYGGLKTDGKRTMDIQRFGISATYKFGNQKLKGKARKKSAIDEELKRIGGNSSEMK